MKGKKEIILGLLILVCIGLLVWGINFLKGTDIFKNQRSYYAVYDKVDGLAPNNPVQVNGLQIGVVNSVNLHPDGSYRLVVKFSITDDKFSFPKKSVARIVSMDLLGSKALQIIPSKEKNLAAVGDTLIGDLQGSIQEEVNKTIAPLKAKTEQLLSSVDSVVVIFRTVLNEKTRDNLIRSFENISLTIKNIASTSGNLDTLIKGETKRIPKILANVESITENFKNNNDKLNNIIQNFATLSDTLAKVELAVTIAKTEKAMSDFALITEKINRGDGSLGMLINNDSLYNELKASATNLERLIKDINENPNRYVHFSIFGRRNKPSVQPNNK